MDSYTVKQISEMLKTNPETVRRWIRLGELESDQVSRKGGNLITASSLNKFLKLELQIQSEQQQIQKYKNLLEKIESQINSEGRDTNGKKLRK